ARRGWVGRLLIRSGINYLQGVFQQGYFNRGISTECHTSRLAQPLSPARSSVGDPVAARSVQLSRTGPSAGWRATHSCSPWLVCTCVWREILRADGCSRFIGDFESAVSNGSPRSCQNSQALL